MVQVVQHDGTPFRPLPMSQRKHPQAKCQKATAEVREHGRAKANGGGVPPARAAATEADRRRALAPAGSGPKPKPKPEPKPEPVNDPTARSLPHPSGNLENGKQQHALHEAMLRGSRHRKLKPINGGADVQVISVCGDARGDRAAKPMAQVIYVRLASRAWTLGAAPVARAITGTVARVRERGDTAGGAEGGGQWYDNATIASDPSGGVYVNHGVRARPTPHPPHTARRRRRRRRRRRPPPPRRAAPGSSTALLHHPHSGDSPAPAREQVGARARPRLDRPHLRRGGPGVAMGKRCRRGVVLLL